MAYPDLHDTDHVIKFKTGVAADINTTATKNSATEGEPHFTTDTDQLYIYDGTQNVRVPTQDENGAITIGDGKAATDIVMTFDGETNDGVLSWMEDEDYFQLADDLLMDERTYYGTTGYYIGKETNDLAIYAISQKVLITSSSIQHTGAYGSTTFASLSGLYRITPHDKLEVAGQLDTTKGRVKNTTRQTTTYTILVTDDVVFCNTDGGAWTATLPAGVEGQTFKIINSGSSTNNLTVAPNGAEDLLGANSNFTLLDGESLIITYNATDGWY